MQKYNKKHGSFKNIYQDTNTESKRAKIYKNTNKK